MFWPPTVAGSSFPTVNGPQRVYGTVPSPVVGVIAPIPLRVFVQVSPTYRGPGMVYAGPGLVVGVSQVAPIPRGLIRYRGASYRGPVQTDTQAPVIIPTPAVFPWADTSYEVPGGRTLTFPPKEPPYPAFELSDLTPDTPRGVPAVWTL